MDRLTLSRSWTIGDKIGAGGFAQVYIVTSDGDEAVAKLIPKYPGADRELLFENLGSVRNVIPIIDSGEIEDNWVIVMPLADQSLRDHLADVGIPLPTDETLQILTDIATALVDLDGKVVHRDLKPENVLLLEGKWCLADFGISRYAEATTAIDTRKFALTPRYAAPEQWRYERATGATDVYSLGVMAYEMLAGVLPFSGPNSDEYRAQHLHGEPSLIEGVPSTIAALVDECLYKAPGARPTASNLMRRLESMGTQPQSGGMASLQEAHRREISRRAEKDRQASVAQTAKEIRRELAESAGKSLTRIGDALRDAILTAAPSATHNQSAGGWTLRLNRATLSFSGTIQTSTSPWKWEKPAINVICHAELNLRIPTDRYQYEGRSHSLWFCDAQTENEFAWYETAFMLTLLSGQRALQDPFSLPPGESSAKALWTGMAEFQPAWPFTRLTLGDLDEFIDRWGGWFANAADERLMHPSHMPEKEWSGSFRRS